MDNKKFLFGATVIIGLLSVGCQKMIHRKQVSVDELALRIDGTDFSKHVAVLSHDSLEGRKPFSGGEKKTIQYLKDQFQKLGLKPGNGNSYFQEVPLVEIESKIQGPLTISNAKETISLTSLEDFVGGTRHITPEISLKNSEIVFVGHGIVAPEFGWNDYQGIDVKGKTVLVMVNDLGYADSTLFRGKNMTYYGRWTYKFEEAARQGAAGVLLIHEQGPVTYGWNVVRSSWGGSKLYLQSPDDNKSFASFEGWLTMASTKKLFKLAGKNEDLLNDARKRGFKPVPLGIAATVNLKTKYKKSISNNVVALLPGTDRKDECIVYTAHWDHLGIGEAIDGDSIYNGAIDNATGTAGLLEIAKGFMGANKNPSRSVLFVAVTAEEQGLLGSEYYANNPVFPVAKTVANINMDAMQPFGRTKDIVITGMGQSELEDYFAEVAKKQGRYTRNVDNPSSGVYFRSDHFNFAKVGIPAMYMNSGSEPTDMTKQEFINKNQKYSKRGYHAPFDEYEPEKWDLRGIVEDLRLSFEVGYNLSNSSVFPQWKEGSEFKSKR
jgi:Zn-dependent M28 family amino/carboxypeptidase